ncbi:MAG: DUF421 domain-containing protein [Clostridia bacterium]
MMLADLFQVIADSVCSLAALFVLTKLLGNRQMSQLTMFDYIIGISIGSIAAEMASHPDGDSWFGLVAMGIYAGIALLMNVLTDKFRRFRLLVMGAPTVLYDRGTLYYNNLKKAKLDLSELMTQCRGAGYFDLAQLQLVLLEVNGKLSFLPNEGGRPLTPADMQMKPKQSRPAIAVIMDGELLKERLKLTGNTEGWLEKQLEAQGFKEVGDILMATVDVDNALAIYEKNEDRESKGYYD